MWTGGSYSEHKLSKSRKSPDRSQLQKFYFKFRPPYRGFCPFRRIMTISDNKPGKHYRGRPRGLGPRTTCCVHGAYSKDLNSVYEFWKKHLRELAINVDTWVNSYARALGWDTDHPRFSELRHLAIRTTSRDLLFMKIAEQDFTRTVHDPVTGYEIRQRPSDQFARLEAIDNEIQERLTALGLFKSQSSENKKKEMI